MAPKKGKGIGSGSGTSAARTAAGGVSAKARAATGTGKNKSYPLPDKAAADAAINLRNSGKTMSAKEVEAKVARSKFGKDPDIKAKLAKARTADKKKG